MSRHSGWVMVNHLIPQLDELEARIELWRQEREALLVELRKDSDLYGWIIKWLEGDDV